MTRIMVTGACGLLGLNLALQAAEQHTVIGVDRLDMLNIDSFEMQKVDLLASGAVAHVLDDVQPDWVIHCAALADVDACEDQLELAQQLNADLPGILAKETARRGLHMVHLSTDAVFDGVRGNYRETDDPNPLNIYARTKLLGEQAVLDNDINAIVARVNFYGWSRTGNRSLAEFFFNNLKAGNPINGFRDIFFCPLLANDLAEILLKMLAAGLHGLYHVVSPEQLSKYQFGVQLAEMFSFDPALITPISVQQSRLSASRSPKLTLNTDKLTQALGHSAPDIQSGLERFFQLFTAGYPENLKKLIIEGS